MSRMAQDDLFGAGPTIVEHVPVETEKVVSWLAPGVVRRLGVDGALKLLGVTRKPGQSALADWRDTMAARSGRSPSEFRQWVDWECNIYGNKSLSLFIWEIA